MLKNPNWIFVFFAAFCKNLFGYGTSPFECRTCLLRRSLTQAGGAKKSTEGNEGNEGLLLRNPNWIFVFFVAFCQNLLVRPKAMRRRIALPTPKAFARPHFPHTAGRQCEINRRRLFSLVQQPPGSCFKMQGFSRKGLTHVCALATNASLSVRSLTTKPNAPAIL